MGALQLTYEPKLKIAHRTHELKRSHEAKSVQLWIRIDPLANELDFEDERQINYIPLKAVEGMQLLYNSLNN